MAAKRSTKAGEMQHSESNGGKTQHKGGRNAAQREQRANRSTVAGKSQHQRSDGGQNTAPEEQWRANRSTVAGDLQRNDSDLKCGGTREV